MILVTGASGNAGGEAVRALLDQGQRVRALTRKGAGPGLPAAAERVTGDLDQPGTMAAALDGASGLFLLPGFRDMPGVAAAIWHNNRIGAPSNDPSPRTTTKDQYDSVI